METTRLVTLLYDRRLLGLPIWIRWLALAITEKLERGGALPADFDAEALAAELHLGVCDAEVTEAIGLLLRLGLLRRHAKHIELPEAATPAASPAPATAAPGQHRQFALAWEALHLEATGKRYLWNGGKDGACVKRMLASVSADELLVLAKRFVERWRTDPWWANKGLSLALLSSQLQALASAKEAPEKPKADRNGELGLKTRRIDFPEPQGKAPGAEDTERRHREQQAEFERMRAEEIKR